MSSMMPPHIHTCGNKEGKGNCCVSSLRTRRKEKLRKRRLRKGQMKKIRPRRTKDQEKETDEEKEIDVLVVIVTRKYCENAK